MIHFHTNSGLPDTHLRISPEGPENAGLLPINPEAGPEIIRDPGLGKSSFRTQYRKGPELVRKVRKIGPQRARAYAGDLSLPLQGRGINLTWSGEEIGQRRAERNPTSGQAPSAASGGISGIGGNQRHPHARRHSDRAHTIRVSRPFSDTTTGREPASQSPSGFCPRTRQQRADGRGLRHARRDGWLSCCATGQFGLERHSWVVPLSGNRSAEETRAAGGGG